MKYLSMALTCALTLSLPAIGFGSELDFRLSNDTISGGIKGSGGNNKLVLGFDHFYKDENTSINISNINLHTTGQTALGNLPTSVMLGLEATHMKEGEFKGSAIAFGGSVKVNLPSTPGLSIEAKAHYAPDIVAYGDSDRYTSLRTQIGYRVIQNADISAGYQYYNTGIKGAGDRTFESGLYIGLRLAF